MGVSAGVGLILAPLLATLGSLSFGYIGELGVTAFTSALGASIGALIGFGSAVVIALAEDKPDNSPAASA